MRKLVPDYSFDTSALIDLKCLYPPDIFPTLWQELERRVKSRNVIAPKEVLNEINKRDDELSRWARKHKQMFKELNAEQVGMVQKILASFPDLVDINKETPDADPFVIALAMAGGDMVVTSEKPANPGGRPKIPDVCESYEIRWMPLIDFFKEMGWKF